MKTFRLSMLCVALATCASCGRKQSSTLPPVVVHVLRDPSAGFAAPLRAANSEFALGKPRLANGRPVIVATNEGRSYTELLGRVGDMPPTLLIIDYRSKLPADVASLVWGAAPVPVCGAIAYAPTSVAGEEREAAELYLRFLEAHCHERHGVVSVDWKVELAKAKATLQKNPRSAFWHNQAGVAYDALGDFGKAVKELKRARALDPTNPEEDYMLYALYKRKGMHREEREVLLDALEKDPNNPLGRFEFAYLLEQEKDWADSLREYQAAERLLTTLSGSQYVDPIGGSYDVDGIRDEVAEAINRVAKLNEAPRNQK
jgi:tetratricopeptide (TPR) repeat protein